MLLVTGIGFDGQGEECWLCWWVGYLEADGHVYGETDKFNRGIKRRDTRS